jgi:hypothetical protein
LLSSLKQSCSLTRDLQLWLRNQAHQVAGFEDGHKETEKQVKLGFSNEIFD